MTTNTKWRKSSYSGGTPNECVELAIGADATGVRDSKNPAGGVLRFGAGSFAAFLTQVKAGELDRP